MPNLPHSALVNKMGTTDPQPICQHGGAHTVDALGLRYQSFADDVNGGLIWDQQSASEETSLRFDAAIVQPFTVLGQRRSASVT